MLNNLKPITVEKPVDLIIAQIRELIVSGQVSPGERLPPERKLAEYLGVSRSNVREAISKLEFYGLLKTMPQSGTVVNGIGTVALEGLISDVLKLEQADFKSLVETRVILERQSAMMAAERRTEEDLVKLKSALLAYEDKVDSGQSGIEEDLLFHIKIAEASKNSVMKSLMMIITPDIVKSFLRYRVCNDVNNELTKSQHRAIYDHIVNQDVTGVAEAMDDHLSEVSKFSKKEGLTK